MASPFQQQSLIRKVIYLGVIIGLFSTSWIWRRYSLEPQADAIAALEQNTGEVAPTDAAIRLSLTGARGFVTCFLWMSAMDKQKKHQWNELEGLVSSLTVLQPHFITPWLFQSWNLTYNVASESDRVNDKYYYFFRGIELLGAGERQNRNYPDVRFNIGMYTQHKICQSDETNVMRSLFQMSIIPPNERDPNRFYKIDAQGRRTINMEEFEQFCKDHPQLVRRLQLGLPRETNVEETQQHKCHTPQSVVQFLTDHRRIPGLYLDVDQAPEGQWTRDPAQDKLRPYGNRFPYLPPPPGGTARPFIPSGEADRWQPVPFDKGALSYDMALHDYHDGYAVARAWYSYSLEPVPPPHELYAGKNKDVLDRVRQRPPKAIASIIFRQYPARTQSFVAERMQQEGWFDGTGWAIPLWFGNRSVIVGVGPNQNSTTAWQEAFRMWREHGEFNHLLYSTDKLAVLEQQTDQFLKAMSLPPETMVYTVPRSMVPEHLLPLYDQFVAFRSYNGSISMSNFRHHYIVALVEQDPETVTARKAFHRARYLHLNADDDDAIAEYEKPEALATWKNKVLGLATKELSDSRKEFRRDLFNQEDSCMVQLRYLALLNKQIKPRVNALCDFLPLMPKTENVLSDWWIGKGPFDVLDWDNQPVIPESVLKNYHAKRMSGRQAPRGQPLSPP